MCKVSELLKELDPDPIVSVGKVQDRKTFPTTNGDAGLPFEEVYLRAKSKKEMSIFRN